MVVAYATVYRSRSAGGGDGRAQAAARPASSRGPHQVEPAREPPHHDEVYRRMAGGEAGGTEGRTSRSSRTRPDSDSHPPPRLLPEPALAARILVRYRSAGARHARPGNRR